MIVRFVPVVAALSFLILAPIASAQQTPIVDQRQENQQNRIGQGIESGQITPREGARLETGQAHVQNLETRAKADGRVTRRERARLTHAQNVQSRHIARAKHNRRHG